MAGSVNPQMRDKRPLPDIGAELARKAGSMRQGMTDRRSVRTRQLLMRAMLELMGSKRYDSISVQELAEQANVGRSTFYAHFAHKDDLIVDGARQLLARFDNDEPQHTGRGARLYPTLALFRHVGQRADMYQTMARGRALPLFLTALQDELAGVFENRLAARVAPGDTPAVPLPLLASMIASMLLTTMRTWIEDGSCLPAEVIDKLFHTVAGPAIRAGLRPQGA